MDLGASGVTGGSARRHAVVVRRRGLGESLRMQTFVGIRLKVTPVKSRNVGRNLAQRQLIASSMSGVTGARVHVLALEHSNEHGPLACRAERMVFFVTILSGRFRNVILSNLMIRQMVVSKTQTQSIASLPNGHIGQTAPPLVEGDRKSTPGR